jgi:hypothetical protein
MNNPSSTLLTEWSKDKESEFGVGFLRVNAPGLPKVSFWALPVTIVRLTENSVSFKWDSGEFSITILGAEFIRVAPSDIPLALFSKGVSAFGEALKIVVSTAETCFVFKLLS